MTLILGALTPEYVVVGADRRISDNGRCIDDESTKLTVLVTPDARTVIAYTGIAQLGSVKTEIWIIEAIRQAQSLTPDLHSILEDLRTKAETTIGQLAKVNPPDIRLTLLVAGMTYQDSGAEAKAWKITNWEHTPDGAITKEFQLITYSPTNPNGTLYISTGNSKAVKDVDVGTLEEMLRLRKPAVGVEKKIHDIIRNASLSPYSGNTIGPQCNTCIVLRDTAQPISATYYSDHTARVVYGVNAVLHNMFSYGSSLTVSDSSPPAVVPKQGRNEPCSCGSGEKYKKCHGIMVYPYLPLTYQMSFEMPPYPASGRSAAVMSRGAASLIEDGGHSR